MLKSVGRLSGEKRLLDFGSGKGVFLSFARDAGYSVVGVETSGPRAKYAKEIFGLEVNSDFYTRGKIFETSFPVVTMFHVLEHIPDAKSLLGNLLSENLEANGVAVIEVPNFSSWQAKWARERWLHIDLPRHVSHFTEDALTHLTDSIGYKIVKKETFSLHLGIIGMTQTVMSWFGYKGFLIGDLKEKKSKGLLAAIAVCFPFAFLLEWFSGLAGRGGVLRFYLKRK
ncbi:MAG: class I SAM-dependent methyltransferase [Chitinophagaceae bacterium]|nr:MAG: class I SAM-dependent methyltransferase [Chitinophagaceae bacterium]